MTARVQFVIVGGLLLLLGMIDFIQRVHVGRDPGLRAFQPPAVQPLPPATSSAAVVAQMREWLPALGGTALDAGEADPSAHVVLQGVFVGRDVSTAVLAFTLPSGGPAQTERVVVGDVVRGWKVTAIDRRSVTVERDEGARALVLFDRQAAEGGGLASVPAAPGRAAPDSPQPGPTLNPGGPPISEELLQQMLRQKPKTE